MQWWLQPALPGLPGPFMISGPAWVGASSKCEVPVRCNGVSRKHLQLVPQDDGLLVKDPGSKNGTRVNGRRVIEALLAVGDVIELGEARYRVEQEDRSDLGLALDFGIEPPNSSLGPPETIMLGGQDDATVGMLAAVVAALDRSTDLALATLVHGGLAGGAWWLEFDGTLPVVLAGTGQPPSQTRSLRLAARALGKSGDGLHHGFDDDGGVYLLSKRGDRVAGIWLGMEPGRERPSLAVAELVLRVLEQAAGHTAPPPAAPVVPARDFPPDIVAGTSQATVALHDELTRLGAGDIPVLLHGETGSGKEIAARLLHRWSRRRKGPFVALNCAAVPPDLLVAELFGVKAGAATGVSARPGVFRQADGGVLFLDEIGEMPLPLQAALLRALQEHEVLPVGADEPVPVDIRVVAASHVDLPAKVADGGFRADLYYRLAGVTVKIPPLRDRREDIPALVSAIARKTARELNKPVRGITAGALETLCTASWPGNVRQLANEVARLVYACSPGGVIDAVQIDEDPTDFFAAVQPPSGGADSLSDDEDLDLQRRVEALERQLVEAAMRRADGNQSRAAELLGLSRNGLRNKLARYGVG